MNPLVTFIISEIVKYVPTLAIELVQLLSKPSVTEEDWDKLKARYAAMRYEDYVPPVGRA